MKPQPNDLANVLRRSVESAANSGHSPVARNCSNALLGVTYWRNEG